jgi:hypothetical protein
MRVSRNVDHRRLAAAGRDAHDVDGVAAAAAGTGTQIAASRRIVSGWPGTHSFELLAVFEMRNTLAPA